MKQAVKIVTITGCLILGSLALGACLFICWCGAIFLLKVYLYRGLLPRTGFFAETLQLVSFEDPLKHMNLANYTCIGLMVMLVILVSHLEAALITVKNTLVRKAKLPPLKLVQHFNDNYDIAFTNSGCAHKPKQAR